ncbi:Protein phosphatase 2C 1 [Rhizophlyctis rosea]|nr:Protein phosphatase 2C 1 [Rhizophlyctis rosea]
MSPAPPSTTSLDDLDDAGPVTITNMDEDDEPPLRHRPSQRGKGKGGDARAGGGGSGEGENSGSGGLFKDGEQSSKVKPSTSQESVGSAKDSADFGSTEYEESCGFQIGVAEDRNKKYRRTMEIFKGLLNSHPNRSVPELLHETFIETDKQLSEKKGLFAGCTAVVAFIQVEEREGAKKRVLYTANVGDARAVLSRDGQAVRLSYDHKGSDSQEARRIQDAGGFVMNNRVNGVLAVTRSLGDINMKEWVIGSPFTTETVLDAKDKFLILACDGLWDVCSDQAAVDAIKDVTDPQQAAEDLLEHALENFSTDNLSILVVRFNEGFQPSSG